MIRIFIADDHAIVRAGLRRILSETSDMKVVTEAVDAADTLEKLRKELPDLLLLDISMPGRSGIDVLVEVKREYPQLPVLVLSLHTEDQYAFRAYKAGASGYLTKESAADQLIEAIRKICRGGKYISPEFAEKLAFRLTTDRDDNRPPHDSLSNREYQVFRMLANGKSVKEIAEELSLSMKTISTNRMRLLQKMRCESNGDLRDYAIRHGLMDYEKV